MTDEKLGSLLEAFANFYWSIPLRIVKEKITDRHSEIDSKQFERVVQRCNKNLFRHHCCVEEEGLAEPELVVEHLVALDRDSFEQFIATRRDLPFCDYDEKFLVDADVVQLELPEARAINASKPW